ncbi:MAG TPA: tetratricopeptide repeat protein [Vicinamibacterales bacterium]|nr:tetratricopeptide repeat protein [Vicinamibacterales bacterium]
MAVRLAVTVAVLLAWSPGVAWADTRSDAKAQVSFGIVAAQHSLWQEARYRFERATAIDPTYAPAHGNLAVAYEQLGLPEKAREAYEKALALEPRNTSIRQNYDLYEEIHARARSTDHR